jgi:hypothetical protein
MCFMDFLLLDMVETFFVTGRKFYGFTEKILHMCL